MRTTSQLRVKVMRSSKNRVGYQARRQVYRQAHWPLWNQLGNQVYSQICEELDY